MFLTQAELVDLTECKLKSRQIAWLKANGYYFAVGANGHARVLREHVQARLSGVNAVHAPVVLEPNWAAL